MELGTQVIILEGPRKTRKTAVLQDLVEQCKKQDLTCETYQFPIEDHPTYSKINKFLQDPITTQIMNVDKYDNLMRENLAYGIKSLIKDIQQMNFDVIIVERFVVSFFAYSFALRSFSLQVPCSLSAEWHSLSRIEQFLTLLKHTPNSKLFSTPTINRLVRSVYQLEKSTRILHTRVLNEGSLDTNDHEWALIQATKAGFQLYYTINCREKPSYKLRPEILVRIENVKKQKLHIKCPGYKF
nr:hypothetical protein [Abalone asfa-like virus]